MIRLLRRFCLFVNQVHHIIGERTNRDDSNKDQWDAHARFLLQDSAYCRFAFLRLTSLYQVLWCPVAKNALRFLCPLLLPIDGKPAQRLLHVGIAEQPPAAEQLGTVVQLRNKLRFLRDAERIIQIRAGSE